MKLLLDLQACQSASRHRGIGRYSMALAQAIVRNARSDVEIWILLNGLYTDSIQPIIDLFSKEIPFNRFVIFNVPGPVAEIDDANLRRARVAEVIRESVIAMIAPDIVHISSLFEGFIDDAVTSIGKIESSPIVVVTLYDLIPLINSDHYFSYEKYKANYLRKIESIKNADLLLAISESSAYEAHQQLGVAKDRIVNIRAAINSDFFKYFPDDVADKRLLSELALNPNFLLYVGNVEPHKNIVGLLVAYSMLCAELKEKHQLAIVVSNEVHPAVRNIAKEHGIDDKNLILLSGIDDSTLVQLYGLAYLFVLPSLHEGFGLPALEAMSCGTPVIGSNCTSIPEVIGRADALFNPRDPVDMAKVINRALTDQDFFDSLRAHTAQQVKKFSWDRTANEALNAMEILFKRSRSFSKKSDRSSPNKKLRLAMITPLPPEQTGIATYCGEIIPALSEFYHLTLITDQSIVSADFSNSDIRSYDWFRSQSHNFDRIVYQTGNSPFHSEMFDLVRYHPGVVVCHDFFLSDLLNWMEETKSKPNVFKNAMYYSHGYQALIYDKIEGRMAAKWRFPGNRQILNDSTGVITHSEYSKTMAEDFYGLGYSKNWEYVPQHRLPISIFNKSDAREKLSFSKNDFIVCAFGFLSPTKLNHILIEAWGASNLFCNKNAKLIFVGQNDGSNYGIELVQKIEVLNECGSFIKITGYASSEDFENYLQAADFAVQLRSLSRGETSRSVLDCMAHRLPVIINANGSMAEYSGDLLVKLPDAFEVAELTSAINEFFINSTMREQLSSKGFEFVKSQRSPSFIAQKYKHAIEKIEDKPESKIYKSIIRQSLNNSLRLSDEELASLHQELAYLRTPAAYKRLLVDISATIRSDLKTGIERVARAFLSELTLSPPTGYSVEAVYLEKQNGKWCYKVARQFYANTGIREIDGSDDLLIPRSGDILLSVDMFDEVVQAESQNLYRYFRASGVCVYFIVYDILPILQPSVFPPGAEIGFIERLRAIVRSSDGLICISDSVADDLAVWLNSEIIPSTAIPRILRCHMGADVESSIPTQGRPEQGDIILRSMHARPTFLMVGTIEPRKFHLQVIQAVHDLWALNIDVNLVIAGREGWRGLPDSARRTIPETINLLSASPEAGRRLFWLNNVSDEFLTEIYSASDALIAASIGEGFGLPLIEAAMHGLPIIARDIPVFREVASTNAHYFSGLNSNDLAQSLQDWLGVSKIRSEQEPQRPLWITWKQSAELLKKIIIQNSNNDPLFVNR